jgi:hypothetical protein
MFRYHVTYGSEKKIIVTDNKAEIKAAIIQQFSLPEGPFLLQMLDCEFEDWVDIECMTTLPDKCKLHVVRGT